MAPGTRETITQLPGGVLYPYQSEAEAFIEEHRGRVLIADDVGLGKTVEALAWLYAMPELRPAVIVCPASVKLQWPREIKKWLGIDHDKISFLVGTKPSMSDLEGAEIFIVNYDILSHWLPAIRARSPRAVIFDEIHYIKDSKRNRSKAARRLAQSASVSSVIGLTGTPVLNRPKELWHPLQVINPKVFPNFFRFATRYCNPHMRNTTAKRDLDGKVLKDDEGQPIWNQSWDFSGASHLDELDPILRDRVMVRRRKVDVSDQLPALTRVTLPFDCNLSGYKLAERDIKTKLLEKRDELKAAREQIKLLPEKERKRVLANRAEANSVFKLYGYAIQMITALKKEAAWAKFANATEWVMDFMENGEPLVIFAHHHEFLDSFAHLLSDKGFSIPPVMDGRMSLAKRQEHALRFSQGEYQAAVCGRTAMGTGVDGLQHAASHLVFLELGWNPASHLQAEGRLFRTGQKNQVTSYYLVALGTIEEDIARLIDAKGTVTSSLVGEMDDIGIIESIIEALTT